MKLKLKTLAVTVVTAIIMLFSKNINAQSSCCSGEKNNKIACATKNKNGEKTSSCNTSAKAIESTSGCSPSSCRGAKTKFGEAKVISNLRTNLIALKAKMEKSKTTKFNARSYDIHGIVGETDDQSLQIIVKEIKLMEKEFSNKTKFKPLAFTMPKNKAKQITYLQSRIDRLKKIL
ncbi:hypothetical protein [Tenacibaculum sp. 190524A02b]|uniref:Uncharacterized protein n=1 Tax=Tenacibaculum vairaonense TaxID=3137860 RepID=A0ABM9PRH1_9FLAO